MCPLVEVQVLSSTEKIREDFPEKIAAELDPKDKQILLLGVGKGEECSRQRERHEHRLGVKTEMWKAQKEPSITSSPGGNYC